MSRIRNQLLALAPEGLFPLAPQGDSPLSAVGLPVSGTLQGEGILVGTPSLFLRLAGCNMRCEWRNEEGGVIPCDTPTALSGESGRYETVRRVVSEIKRHRGALSHLVITGGEPLLQSVGLVEFLALLRSETANFPFHVTLETNGTIFNSEVSQYIDLASISPKVEPHFLPSHEISLEKYAESLQQWLDAKWEAHTLQLKFVVANERDGYLIRERYLDRLSIAPHHTICVMPAGMTEEQLKRTTPFAVAFAVKHGWRFSPRLHIALWGNTPGC